MIRWLRFKSGSAIPKFLLGLQDDYDLEEGLNHKSKEFEEIKIIDHIMQLVEECLQTTIVANAQPISSPAIPKKRKNQKIEIGVYLV